MQTALRIAEQIPNKIPSSKQAQLLVALLDEAVNEGFRKEFGADITVLDMEPVDASSTEIRDTIKRGGDISGLVLPRTEEYIIEHKLYR